MPAPKDPEKRKEWIENMKKNHADFSGKNNPCYKRTGSKHPMFGKYAANRIYSKIKTSKGYWLIWINRKRVKQARYIAEQSLGRALKKEEVVHHINEIKDDDRPENLYIFATKEKHMRHHKWKLTPLLTSNLTHQL